MHWMYLSRVKNFGKSLSFHLFYSVEIDPTHENCNTLHISLVLLLYRSKMKLRILLLAAAGAGTAAQNPFDDLMKCAQAGASSDECTATTISDGEHCKFCSSDSLGQAICTTSQASQAMKQFLPDLDCGADSITQEVDEKTGSTDELSRLIFLSAIGVTAQDPFSDIMTCAQLRLARSMHCYRSQRWIRLRLLHVGLGPAVDLYH